MTRRLEGRVVILTGGTRGMGEAEVRGMIAEGAKVVFGGRDEKAGMAIADDLGESAVYVPQDVARRDDWDRIVDIAMERFGRIDGLVNNAGFGLSKPLADTTDEDWDQVIAINQTAVFYGMRAVIPRMLQNGGGSIINISSPAGIKGLAHLAAYSAAKAAVIGMSRSAAIELAARNIRVNVIIPGFFDTRLLHESSNGTGVERGSQVVPMRRVAAPDEIVGAVVFLMSPESGYITGVELKVDGGFTS